MLHPIGKKVYKLELLKKWRIYDVFYVSLLEKDITRKGQGDDKNAANLDIGNMSEEYKVEAIWDSKVCIKESESDHLLGL